MKLYIYLLLIALSVTISKAQEFGKNLGSVYLTIDGKLPKEYVFKDDQVTIKVVGESMSNINFEIRNNSDGSAKFLWADSYFVSMENTIPFSDMNKGTAAAFGITTTETNSINPATRIGAEAKITIKASSSTGMLFDYRAINKYYEENGKLPNDRAVLAFEIDGSKVEKVIPIQVYTTKIKKQLKK